MLTSSFKQLSHPLVFKKHGDIWGIGIAYLQSQNSFRQKKKKKKEKVCMYVCLCGCSDMYSPGPEKARPICQAV